MALVSNLILYYLAVFSSSILANPQNMLQEYCVELRHGYAAGYPITNSDFDQNFDLHKIVSDFLNDGKDAFVSIFDGETLDNWQMSGDGGFTIDKNDSSLRTQGGPGSLWFSDQKYKDFTLKLEWKVSQKDDNSGVFVRFPYPDEEQRVEAREGYEIQIDDSAYNATQRTGAIYNIAASNQMVSEPAGMWNTMIIRVVDQLYTVFINGYKVVDFVGDRSTQGYIGLQAHDDQSHVAFRNIMIEDIK